VKTVGFHPEAQDEYDNALTVSRDPTEFRRVVDEAVQKVASGIITHAAIRRTPCRECGLRPLPYSIIYSETETAIRVWAFAHHKRRPGYWRRRLP
jgi:hypothetical protein